MPRRARAGSAERRRRSRPARRGSKRARPGRLPRRPRGERDAERDQAEAREQHARELAAAEAPAVTRAVTYASTPMPPALMLWTSAREREAERSGVEAEAARLEREAVSHARLERSMRTERHGRRSESGGIFEAASCSRMYATLIAVVEAAASPIAIEVSTVIPMDSPGVRAKLRENRAHATVVRSRRLARKALFEGGGDVHASSLEVETVEARVSGPQPKRVLCGAEGDRTPDLRIANAALSQLSYGPRGAQCSAELVLLSPVDRRGDQPARASSETSCLADY